MQGRSPVTAVCCCQQKGSLPRDRVANKKIVKANVRVFLNQAAHLFTIKTCKPARSRTRFVMVFATQSGARVGLQKT